MVLKPWDLFLFRYRIVCRSFLCVNISRYLVDLLLLQLLAWRLQSASAWVMELSLDRQWVSCLENFTRSFRNYIIFRNQNDWSIERSIDRTYVKLGTVEAMPCWEFLVISITDLAAYVKMVLLVWAIAWYPLHPHQAGNTSWCKEPKGTDWKRNTHPPLKKSDQEQESISAEILPNDQYIEYGTTWRDRACIEPFLATWAMCITTKPIKVTDA